jgi:hypothetical protein
MLQFGRSLQTFSVISHISSTESTLNHLSPRMLRYVYIEARTRYYLRVLFVLVPVRLLTTDGILASDCSPSLTPRPPYYLCRKINVLSNARTCTHELVTGVEVRTWYFTHAARVDAFAYSIFDENSCLLPTSMLHAAT